MIKGLNNKSLAYGIPGLLVQSVGFFLHPLVALAGSILLIVGLGYYARAKGHSGYLGLLGLLSWLGVLVLVALKDRHETEKEMEARKTTKPKDIILGIILGLALVIGVPLLMILLFR